jgi:hypothetical protein
MARRPRFEHIQEGEPYYPPMREHALEQCCDCGLVHRTRYEVEDRRGRKVTGVRVKITLWRDG